MKVATYNLLKGGSQRSHWRRMVEEQSVDLLLVQESYPQEEHFPLHLFPEHRNRSVWAAASNNKWGSAVFTTSGYLSAVSIPGYDGWVTGCEIQGAEWLAAADSILAFSIHAPDGEGSYVGQVNRILDEIAVLARQREVIIAGDFNLTISHWEHSARPTRKADLRIQQRLADEFELINCWSAANPDQELPQTLRWSRDRTIPYHCDGIFAPSRWRKKLESCEVLSGPQWDALSDHNPVVASFA